jgi:hypothetical protein
VNISGNVADVNRDGVPSISNGGGLLMFRTPLAVFDAVEVQWLQLPEK